MPSCPAHLGIRKLLDAGLGLLLIHCRYTYAAEVVTCIITQQYGLIWASRWRCQKADDIVQRSSSTESDDPGDGEASLPVDRYFDCASCGDEAGWVRVSELAGNCIKNRSLTERRPHCKAPSGKSSPIKASSEPVDAFALSAIEVRHSPVLAPDQPEVYSVDTSKWGDKLRQGSVKCCGQQKENSPRTHHAKTAQHSDKSARRIDKPPRVDEITNKTHDQTSAGHINPSRRKSRKIHATRHRVLHQICGNLRDEEAHAGEETARARRSVVVIFQQKLQN